MNKTLLTALLCCLMLTTPGCGKKGDPVPQDKKNLFSWESADAAFTANGCLAISAVIKGATRNVDSFAIELEPLNAPENSTLPAELRTQQDTCEGCPFAPQETGELSPQRVTDNENAFRFTYCPSTKAAAYRWRLVARNVFMSFPYALTPIKTLR